jgi:methane monooxygenase PmoA-like
MSSQRFVFSALGCVTVLAAISVCAVDASESVLALPGLSEPLCIQIETPEGQDVAPGAQLTLVEAGHPDNRPVAQAVPFVTAEGLPAEGKTSLVATITPGERVGKDRRFKLTATEKPTAAAMKLTDPDDKSIQIAEGDHPVLVYNHGVITKEEIPETEHRRSRACYVHPVYGLSGEVLTDDFPRDHYHHHGIFWTWPHVTVDGTEHDLWAGSTIRQQFVSWLAKESGPAAAVLGVENGWFVGDKKVMIERVWVRVYGAVGDARAVDIDLTLIPTDKPVTLWGAAGKSYGGLTVRFKPPARRDPETVITTPSGVAPRDLTTTILRWSDYTSKFDGRETPSGAAIFISPTHPDYPPEWLLRHYGPLCVGWPGVSPETLQPGKPVTMSYRFWIHKDAVGTTVLSRAYSAYLAGLEAAWME